MARIATRQHGVVSLAQLHRLGWSTGAVVERATNGRLHRLHRGVYAVGHGRITQRGRWIAAVLACGPDALLSHRSAAHLRGLRSWSPGIVAVTAPRKVRSRTGVRSHRTSNLTDDDRDLVDAIPCVSVARILLGLAAVDPGSLEEAVAAAERRSMLDHGAIDELLIRAPAGSGVLALRAAVAGIAVELEWTRSELELRFLALCRNAGLPRPRVNAWVEVPGDGFEVDFSWPAIRLAVEVDGWETHGDRRAFERDRRRDQLLVAGRWRVVRVTWRQLTEEPGLVGKRMQRLMRPDPAG